MKKPKGLVLIGWLAVFSASVMIVSNAGTQKGSSSLVDKPIETVDFCDLVSRPEDHARRVVRTKATYTENAEGTALAKADCAPGKNIQDTFFGRTALAEVQFDCSNLKTTECILIKQELRQNLHGDPVDGASAEVTVIGWIEPLNPLRTQAGFNVAPISFHVQKVESPNLATRTSRLSKLCFVRKDWIYLRDIRTGHENGLVRGAWPELSPDGNSVAFVPVNEAGTASSQLKVISLTSHQVQEFKNLSAYGASKPRWSQDGTRIAFETSSNDIGILDPSTGAWRNLTADLDIGSLPGGIDFDSWVFGDKSLLFHTLENLYEVGVDGSLLSKIPIDHLGISSATRFSLSPNRKLLLFDRTIDTEERPLNGVISVLDIAANKLVMVTPDTIEGRTPRWISSEREILFTCLKRFNNGNPGICRIAVDGTNLSTLATSADVASYSVNR